MKQCSFPCTTVAQDRNDLATLRAHLLEGHQCLDAWLSMSRLVSDPRQRRDCLQRAAVLAPENVEIRERWLEAVLAVEPNNTLAQTRLNEIHTMRLLTDVKTSHFTEQKRARLLGQILVDMGAISSEELREVLRTQNNGMPITTDRRLGQLLLRKRKIAPVVLAQALISQQQERSSLRVAPQVLGEYLVEQGLITPQQLELVLAEQLQLDLQGQRLSLGQIIVRLNLLPSSTIERAAVEHQRTFWSQHSY
ncbi:hypothetical protein [Candidatus Viridilinea mediisalina]|uniref:Type II secretion system protein GspE N-terminal domain-containing protein n=1 Tax=Candidatus Viridilinea mediisalina TaxID=2024553 RepID=A0A2A6RJL8_9CHLR|nr:hypothetical protein [Candidatus Viridilinea mediisalina]PDW03040.1 hypothetical protein CJ255_10990 [Candidatus Viridilinea mediisalina]